MIKNMQKLRLTCLTLLTIFTTLGVSAEETRYITEERSVITRAGPGNNYKLTSPLKAGEAVSLLETEGRYSKVRNSSGKDLWVITEELTSQTSSLVRVPQLELQVNELTQKLNTIDDTWTTKTAEMKQKVDMSDSVINGLKSENAKLKEQLSSAQKTANAISVQLDDKKRSIILQWFMYGGGVAGAGLLLGLLLPRLIPSRKSSRWMN